MPAAYFDVDGTLVRINLLPPTLLYLANQASPLESLRRLGGMALDTPFLVASELQDRRLFNERLFSHFRGMSEDRMVVLSRDVFDTVVRPNICRGAKDLVQRCKDSGHRVVLITGSLDCTIKPLAEYFGADGVIANRLEYKGGYATGKLLRPVVAGPHKARMVEEDARTHGHALEKCQAYSDSYSDLPMLSVVGHPFCIRPDRRLTQLARAYSWPILDIDQSSPGESSPRTVGGDS